MKKILERILIFFIGIPAVAALVLFLPFYNNLIMNIFVIAFSAIGAFEFSKMLENRQLKINRAEAVILGSSVPLAATLTASFNLPEWLFPFIFVTGAGWVLLSGVFTRAEKMEIVLSRITAGFSVMMYPGFFMCWVVKMTIWENSPAILVFLLIVFGSDSMAWLFGNLFGSKNRGIIAASPNKSIAGFIGGIIGTVIVAGGAALIVPDVFISRLNLSAVLAAVLLGICTGIAATLGDLAESAIKRSCGFKDSGNIILGRGGILDSIDSIAAAAPVYFLLFNIFFAG